MATLGVAAESWWQGGNGGKLSRTVATLAIGGKIRAQLQVQADCGGVVTGGAALEFSDFFKSQFSLDQRIDT